MFESPLRLLASLLTAFLLLAGTTASLATEADQAFGAASILTVRSFGVLGPYLADGAGRPLYLRLAVGEVPVPCDASCSLVWPPLVSESSLPVAGDATVSEGLIGSVELEEGLFQVTYKGHPLYYHARDEGAESEWEGPLGQAIHDEWGGWYLITPKGAVLDRLRDSPEAR